MPVGRGRIGAAAVWQKKRLGGGMSEDNSIVPYHSRKRFTVGDGSTRFTEPGERPLTGEEKYQKPLHETVLDMRDAITDASIAIINAFEPVFKAMTDLSDELMKVPEFRTYIDNLEKGDSPAEDPKAASRARSRADVRDKRKSMMKRRGRK
jgi:hypothetical protein